MDDEKAAKGNTDALSRPLAVRIWFDWYGANHHAMWWKPISFMPPIGMNVVPFDDEALDEWMFEFEDVTVTGFIYMAQQNLVVVRTEHHLSDVDIPEFIDEAMAKAGWIKGDDGLWA